MAPKKKATVKKVAPKKVEENDFDFNLDEDNSQEVLEVSKVPTDTKKHELVEELKGIVNDDATINHDDWTEESLAYVIKKVKYDKQVRKELREELVTLKDNQVEAPDEVEQEIELDESPFNVFNVSEEGVLSAMELGGASRGGIVKLENAYGTQLLFIPTIQGKVIKDASGIFKLI